VRLSGGAVTARLRGTEREQGATDVALRTAAFALGWRPVPAAGGDADGRPLLRLRPVTP
jgi:hypothetical protein